MGYYVVNVNSAGLNVRKGPGTEYDLAPVGRWYNGTVVYVNKREGSWSYANDTKGNYGWCMSSYLFPQGMESSASAPEAFEGPNG